LATRIGILTSMYIDVASHEYRPCSGISLQHKKPQAQQ